MNINKDENCHRRKKTIINQTNETWKIHLEIVNRYVLRTFSQFFSNRERIRKIKETKPNQSMTFSFNDICLNASDCFMISRLTLTNAARVDLLYIHRHFLHSIDYDNDKKKT